MIPSCIAAIEDDGDRAFMENLYVTYQRLMYCEINKILKDEWDTEDMMQSVLINLIGKLPELRTKPRDRLVNYIISTCKNVAYNFLRSHGKYVHIPLDDYVPAPAGDSSVHGVEIPVIRAEEVALLDRIWPRLDSRSRYLLESYYILGIPTQALADALGVKRGSVRVALTRARQRAFDLLQAELSKQR